MSNLKSGFTLPNGASVLVNKGDQVLASFRGEFVAWTINRKDNSCFWGHYFDKDVNAAFDYFRSKTSERSV